MIFAFHAVILNCFSIYFGVNPTVLLSPRMFASDATSVTEYRGSLNILTILLRNSMKKTKEESMNQHYVLDLFI